MRTDEFIDLSDRTVPRVSFLLRRPDSSKTGGEISSATNGLMPGRRGGEAARRTAEKECGPSSRIRTLKVRYFPGASPKPLKGGQLLAAQFNQKIKHRGSSRARVHPPVLPSQMEYIQGSPEIATRLVCRRRPVISKTRSNDSHRVEGQNQVPTEFLLRRIDRDIFCSSRRAL